MRIIKVFLFTLFLFLFNNLYSQYKYDRVLKVGYAAGYPFGDLGNYVEGKAYDGITVDFEYFIKDNVSIGLSTGWNSFSKRYARNVYPLQNGEISAVQTRFFRSIPVLATGHYFFREENAKFFPYAGIGIGAYMLHYEKWYGVFPEIKDIWSFGVRPEAGIFLPITERVGLNFNVRYNVALYSYKDIKNFHFPEANLGVFFYLY